MTTTKDVGVFRCGHPKIPNNVHKAGFAKNGTPRVRCGLCKREKNRVYQNRPETKAKAKAYQGRPEVKERRLEFNRKYSHTPHGRASEARRRENPAYIARRAKQVASGKGAKQRRDEYQRRKTYLAQIFAETPDKRHQIDAEAIVVLSDIHFPFDDPDAVREAIATVDRLRPDTVVLNGDIVDCYLESRFLKKHEIAETSTPEGHTRARQFMQALEDVPQKIWLGGNHEDRFTRQVWDQHRGTRFSPIVANLMAMAKEIGSQVDLRDPSEAFKTLYGMAQYKFEYFPVGHRLYFAQNNLVVTHGKYLSRHSGYSAKRTFEWLGRSCIVGHTHRQGTYRITMDGREYGAWENGCLCTLNPDWDDTPNWQQGFSVVKIDGPEFHVVQIPIVRRGNKPVAVTSGLGE